MLHHKHGSMSIPDLVFKTDSTITITIHSTPPPFITTTIILFTTTATIITLLALILSRLLIPLALLLYHYFFSPTSTTAATTISFLLLLLPVQLPLLEWENKIVQLYHESLFLILWGSLLLILFLATPSTQGSLWCTWGTIMGC